MILDGIKQNSGADALAIINRQDVEGNAVLHHAVFPSGRRADIIKALMVEGANCDLVNQRGESAWVLAINNETAPVVLEGYISGDLEKDSLMKLNLLSSLGGLGSSAYERQIINNLIQKASQELQQAKQNYQSEAPEISTLLSEIYQEYRGLNRNLETIRGKLNSVLLLVNLGADVNTKTSSDFTAMHFAARLGDASLLYSFIARGAAIEALTQDKQTLLHHAASSGSILTTHVVLEAMREADAKGFDEKIIQQDEDSKTALYRATLGCRATDQRFSKESKMIAEILLSEVKEKNDSAVKRAAQKIEKLIVLVTASAISNGLTTADEAVVDVLVEHHSNVLLTADHPPFREAMEESLKLLYNNLKSPTTFSLQKSKILSGVMSRVAQLVSAGAEVNQKWQNLTAQDFAVHLNLTKIRQMLVNVEFERAEVAAANYAAAKLINAAAEELSKKDFIDLKSSENPDEIERSIKAKMLQEELEKLQVVATARPRSDAIKASIDEAILSSRYLIEQGVDVNTRTAYGNTALHLAIASNSLVFLRFLLHKGADATACNQLDQTPLHYAVLKDNMLLVFAVLDAMMDQEKAGFASKINQKDFNGNTPLHCAEVGYERDGGIIIRVLIGAGADYNLPNGKYETLQDLARNNPNTLNIIHHYKKTGKAGVALIRISMALNLKEKIKTLTLEEKATLDAFAKKGLEILEDLLPKTPNPADENVEKIMMGSLSLISARIEAVKAASSAAEEKYAYLRNLDGLFAVVVKAVEMGADPNVTITGGLTALHLANYLKKPNLIQRLTELGAINSSDKSGTFPQGYYGSLDRLKVAPAFAVRKIRNLDKEKASEMLKSELELFTLLQAGNYQDSEIDKCFERAAMIIESGAEVNLKTSTNFTPLHLATCKNNCKLVLSLLKNGAEVTATNNENDGALQLLSRQFFAKDLFVIYALLNAIKRKGPEAAGHINLKSAADDNTILHRFLRSNTVSLITTALIYDGADYNLPNRNGETGLDLAQLLDHSVVAEVIKIMQKNDSKEIDGSLGRIRNYLILKQKNDPDLDHQEIINEYGAIGFEELKKLVSRGDKEVATKIMFGILQVVCDNIRFTQAKPHLKNLEPLMNLLPQLIDAGADVNLRIPPYSVTALHCADFLKMSQLRERLLTRGAASDNLEIALGETSTELGKYLFLQEREIAPPAPLKTAKEKLSELQNLIASLQRAVKTSVKEKTEEVERMLFLLEDLDYTQKKPLLQLAIRFGNGSQVTRLLEKGVEPDANILHAGVEKGDDDILKALLKSELLDFGEIFNELESSIKNKRQVLASALIKGFSEEIIPKFLAQKRAVCNDQMTKMASFEKKVTTIAKKELSKFLAVARENLAVKPRQEELQVEEVGSSKAERKQDRKAKYKLEVEAQNNARAAAQSAKKAREEAALRLSPEQQKQQQLQNFLQGPRQINSVSDLPEFLQRPIENLIRQGCTVSIKGSAAYLASDSKRLPGDLDIEVVMPNLGDKTQWSDEAIKDFFSRTFDLEIPQPREGLDEIFRGKIFRKQIATPTVREIFTFGLKFSGLNIDLTAYDPSKMPLDHLQKMTNVEEKITFLPDLSATPKLPRPPLRIVSPKAHGLLLRLSFLAAIEHVTLDEVMSEVQRIPTINPAELLFKEFQLHKYPDASTQDEAICKKIAAASESHSFNENERRKFVENLVKLADLKRSPTPDARYSQLYATLHSLNKISQPSPLVAANIAHKMDREVNSVSRGV